MMQAKIVHELFCSLCENTHEKIYRVSHIDSVLPKIHLPEEWRLVGSLLVCPKHDAKVQFSNVPHPQGRKPIHINL